MIRTMTKKQWDAEVAKRRDQQNWYALHTRPQHEKKAADQIKAWYGIESYCPMRQEVHQWSDRKKTVETPLLRGYVLVKATEKERITALQHPSVTHCLNYLGRPAIIRDQEIVQIKTFINNYQDISIRSLKPGQTVILTDGTFAGLQGIVHDTTSNKVILVLPTLGFRLEAPITAVKAVM